MRHLPDELILHIIAYLEPAELVKLQHVSRQLLNLSRDNNLWKTLCFEHSTAEQRRRRLASTQEPPAPDADADPRLAELIEAANTLSATFDTSVHDPRAPSADVQAERNREKRRVALLANWDPSYPGEPINWYADFIQRHAPPHIAWFEGAGPPREDSDDDGVCREATGAGILFDSGGLADRLIAPADDGSIAIWDARETSDRRGALVSRSEMGLLANRGSELDFATRLRQSQAIMTDSGAVECVSIDSVQRKAFFGVQNTLNQVDLSTLQVVARTPYPFPITALSEAHHTTPLTVGTNWTLHLHDPRQPAPALTAGDTDTSFSRLSGTAGHVSLAQPGALSIAHLPTTRSWDGNGDIWVSGRFTSLLNFDRRFFPRLRGTLHSGARISCLTTLPHPFVPHALRVGSPSALAAAKAAPGFTLVAAGEYKGKGSLELYGLSPDPVHSVSSTDARSAANAAAAYQNRQTAARSKLLSVAAHGSRLVFADGDGGLKWVERDAATPVRNLNVNDFNGTPSALSSPPPSSSARQVFVNASSSSAADDMRAEAYVQKILPTTLPTALSPAPLVFWTSAGALGTLSFGSRAPGEDVFVDALEHQLQDGGERARERAYGAEMRRALEMQARELRWLRGYGL